MKGEIDGHCFNKLCLYINTLFILQLFVSFYTIFLFFQTNDKFKLPSDRNHLPTNFWISQIFKCASYSTAETHFCSGKTHFCWAKIHFRQLKHTFVQVKHTFVDGSLKRLQLCMFDYCFYRQQVRICHL